MIKERKIKINFILYIFLSILLFNNYVKSQEELDYIEKKVKKYIKWMINKENFYWKASLRLKELGKKAIPIIKRELLLNPDMPDRAKVGCAKALINLGERDYGINILLKILEKENKDENARIVAADLLGIYGDYMLEEKLLHILDNTYSPYVKIAIAKALWNTSKNPQATKILKEFLKSGNIDIKYTAALALGEINNVKIAKPILSQLKEEPSLRGRLAKILLEKEAILDRYYEKTFKSRRRKVIIKKVPKYPVVDEVLQKIKEYHINGDKFKDKELITAALKGMVESTDIHSAFWTKKEYDEFVRSMIKESYVGIGVYVGIRNGYFTVIAPIYSGPAYRAGIRTMDRILAVDGWSTTGKPIDEIIKRIRGKEGTTVKLKIYREGWSKVREIVVKREKIRIPSLFYQMLPANIGYIKLIQFGAKASSDMEKALKDLEKQGMKALILDLRGNGGGWLKAAVDIIDKFLPGGKLIVYSKGRNPEVAKKTEYYSSDYGTHPNYPMAILVDQSTASASEIVSGCLQYYKRAIIVGTQTYGKGSVQQPFRVITRPGAVLKLTIAKYYLPDGRCIHNKMTPDGRIIKHNGIIPDIKVDYEKWSAWKIEEKDKLEKKKAFKKYIDKYFNKYKKLFYKLAVNDELCPEKYPHFKEWYKSLNTKLSPNDVRYWLREKIRRKVADDRGKEFACDYLEDIMLKRAIIEMCKKLNIKIESIKDYKVFLKKNKK